jgi:hypothetical protein
MRVMTGNQSRVASCRNWRTVGYQGVSSRSRNQRQQPLWRFINQTGLPRAPARCTTDVSTEITRSKFATRAAVSEKSSRPPRRAPAADVGKYLSAEGQQNRQASRRSEAAYSSAVGCGRLSSPAQLSAFDGSLLQMPVHQRMSHLRYWHRSDVMRCPLGSKRRRR